MNDDLMARGAALAGRRVERVLAAIADADLPPGVTAVRDGDDIVIAGRDLARRLAFDPRMAAIGLIARDA